MPPIANYLPLVLQTASSIFFRTASRMNETGASVEEVEDLGQSFTNKPGGNYSR